MSALVSMPRIEWRDLPDSRYLVSEFGAVASRYLRVTKILAPVPNGNGYPFYTLRLSTGRVLHWPSHRLVALLWLGPCPEGMETRHLDGRVSNNHFTNLAYGTHLENVRDSIRHGTAVRGERQGSAKLTDAIVAEARARYRGGASQKHLARELGVTRSVICDALVGVTWAHVAEPVVVLRTQSECEALKLGGGR